MPYGSLSVSIQIIASLPTAVAQNINANGQTLSDDEVRPAMRASGHPGDAAQSCSSAKSPRLPSQPKALPIAHVDAASPDNDPPVKSKVMQSTTQANATEETAVASRNDAVENRVSAAAANARRKIEEARLRARERAQQAQRARMQPPAAPVLSAPASSPQQHILPVAQGRQQDALNFARRKAQLQQFYSKHNPGKVGDAEMLLRRFPFADLVGALRKKFGAVPDGWDADNVQISVVHSASSVSS